MFTPDWQAAFVTVVKVFIEFARQFDRFGFISGFQALADVWLAWKCDSALPDRRHGIGALVDDDATSQSSRLDAVWRPMALAPFGRESKQAWAGWSRTLSDVNQELHAVSGLSFSGGSANMLTLASVSTCVGSVP